MTNFIERLADANLRFDRIVWLPAALSAGEDCEPQGLRDFYEEMPEKPDDQLYHQLPALSRIAERIADDDWPENWEISETLLMAGPQGFLVQAATPVPSFSKEYSGFSFSWGHYYTTWIYDETLEGLVRKSEAWAEQMREKAKAKQLGAAA